MAYRAIGILVFTVSAGVAAADVLQVDLGTGRITWVNESGGTLDVAAYTIGSPGNHLVPGNWTSIADNYDMDNGGLVDLDDTWIVFGGAVDDLSEGTVGEANLAPAQRIDLGNGVWSVESPLELTFEYLTAANQVVVGSVQYGLFESLGGDFDLDLDVDGNDFLAWQSGFGTMTGALHADGDADYDGDVDGNDFLVWQGQFGSSAGAGGAAPAALSVPEPTSAMLATLASLLWLPWRRSLKSADRNLTRPAPDGC